MEERIRPRNASEGIKPAEGPLSPLFGLGGDPSGVSVTHGPFAENLPLAGMTVGEIRARYRDRFGLDPHAQATLDGEPVAGDTIVRAGQTLSFVHRVGEKGRERAA